MKKCRRFLLLTLLLGALFYGDYFWLKGKSQSYCETYLNESIALATGTYATCRIINAGVSTLQESSVAISPWGVGVQVQPGQILDPINDASERLSTLCANSLGLLAAQRVLLLLINNYTIIPFYLLAFGFLLTCFWFSGTRNSVFILRLVLLISLLRLSTPIMCFVGIYANEHYFGPRIEASLHNLKTTREIAGADFEYTPEKSVFELNPEHELGPIETVQFFFSEMYRQGKRQWIAAKYRTEQMGKAIRYLKTHVTEIIEDLTRLFATLLSKVIIQVFFIPLGTLFCLRWAFQQISDLSLTTFITDLKTDKNRRPVPSQPCEHI